MGFGSLSSQQRIMVLLELAGGPKFAAQMKNATAQTTALGRATETAGRKTFLANQALYTLRRYAFYGTTAVIGLTAVVAKLGYSYLSAMQQARVALSPVIKDHTVLEGYLNRLFKISKYSPFVLKDLAIGFRQLFAGLNPIGISAPTILTTIQSLTDFMAYTGKTGPGQFQRVALAIQHMAFAGRLTGYAVNQLSRDGIPIFAILNKELGITGDQLHNISKMGIPAATVLAAINKYAREAPAVRGAAMRLSLQSLSGLLQVARDSLSQLSGTFIKGAYGTSGTGKKPGTGIQGWLYGLLRPGGPLDQLSTRKTSNSAILMLSQQITGNKGLGQGLLLLLQTARLLGTVFAHIVAPAFVIALHSLILFYPIIKLVNLGLGFMAKNAYWLKYVFALLAAEFILTNSRLIVLWGGMKLFRIATFGAIGPLMSTVRWLIAFYKAEKTLAIAKLVTNWSKWAFALKAGGKAEAVWGVNAYKNTGLAAKFSRALLSLKSTMKGLAVVTWTAVAPIAAYVVAILALVAAIYGLRKLAATLNQGNAPQFRGGWWNPVQWLAYPGEKILGQHGSSKKSGSKITPSANATPAATNPSAAGGGTITTVHQLVVDRKVLAEAVEKSKSDKQARR